MSVSHAIVMTYISAPTGEASLVHRQRLGVTLDASNPDPAFQTPLSNILLRTYGQEGQGATTNAFLAITGYINRFTEWAAGSIRIQDIGLYRYPDGTGGMSQIVTLADLTDAISYPTLQGQRPGSNTEASEITLSFATTKGKNGIVKYLEAVGEGTGVLSPANVASNAELLALVNYLSGEDSWITMAGGAFPIQFRKATLGQNEAVWRKRYR